MKLHEIINGYWKDDIKPLIDEKTPEPLKKAGKVIHIAIGNQVDKFDELVWDNITEPILYQRASILDKLVDVDRKITDTVSKRYHRVNNNINKAIQTVENAIVRTYRRSVNSVSEAINVGKEAIRNAYNAKLETWALKNTQQGMAYLMVDPNTIYTIDTRKLEGIVDEVPVFNPNAPPGIMMITGDTSRNDAQGRRDNIFFKYLHTLIEKINKISSDDKDRDKKIEGLQQDYLHEIQPEIDSLGNGIRDQELQMEFYIVGNPLIGWYNLPKMVSEPPNKFEFIDSKLSEKFDMKVVDIPSWRSYGKNMEFGFYGVDIEKWKNISEKRKPSWIQSHIYNKRLKQEYQRTEIIPTESIIFNYVDKMHSRMIGRS